MSPRRCWAYIVELLETGRDCPLLVHGVDGVLQLQPLQLLEVVWEFRLACVVTSTAIASARWKERGKSE